MKTQADARSQARVAEQACFDEEVVRGWTAVLYVRCVIADLVVTVREGLCVIYHSPRATHVHTYSVQGCTDMPCFSSSSL